MKAETWGAIEGSRTPHHAIMIRSTKMNIIFFWAASAANRKLGAKLFARQLKLGRVIVADERQNGGDSRVGQVLRVFCLLLGCISLHGSFSCRVQCSFAAWDFPVLLYHEAEAAANLVASYNWKSKLIRKAHHGPWSTLIDTIGISVR